MAAIDVTAQVRAWALAEADRQCFGEEFGVDVAWDAIPVAVPGGQAVQVGYRLVISCRSPLLGEGPLFALAPLVTAHPTAEQVSEAVTALLQRLREISRAKLATSKAAVSRAMS